MLDTAKKPTRPIALDLQDIHKSYGSLEVLKGVSLTAYDGDVISILGSSGSGKSTVAGALEQALFARGVSTYLLDSDRRLAFFCE